MTTAPISSGRDAKHSPISRMMPSFSALRLAGRFRPTVRTRSARSILSSPEPPASAVSAFPCVICVLVRIVMLYNEFGHGAEIDQFWINRLAALELLQQLDRTEAHALVLDIDGRTVVGLEGVSGFEIDQLVRADGLEVGTERQHLAGNRALHLAADD